MPEKLLQLFEVEGTPFACGVAYGKELSSMIFGIYSQEMKSHEKRRIPYAKKCWKRIQKNTPESASFIRGVSKGAKIEIERLVLLLLHEEIIHNPHCSAFMFRSRGKTIVAQNWDWPSALYPWPGLLKLKFKSRLRTLTYGYPGLWSASGINEAGLSLMWTGSGYYPKVRPRIGIPTYVVVAELLTKCSSVDLALSYLKKIRYAGSFIFFIADAFGNRCIVEAVPKKFVVDMSRGAVCRANHFICQEIISLSKQRRSVLEEKGELWRYGELAKLLKERRRTLSRRDAQEILIHKPAIHDINIDEMTIDSLFAIPEEKILYTARGGHNPGPWQKTGL